MRTPWRKEKVRTIAAKKDVRLSTRSNGLGADGTQRWAVVFAFYNESEKKVTSTSYIAFDTDFDANRVYFVGSDEKEGWKLIGDKSVREISPTIRDRDEWDRFAGEYNLLKDTASNDYYIDLVRRKEVED